ncbi:DOMON-like domain-containing protein [Candidatus Ozemobacteraceae bacterium]|nr:DOMON-like domain-containing protein [Candidatus Ozemobacteraceae bacterium]
MTRPFRLEPFPGSVVRPGMSISGSASRREDSLTIRFDVSGDIGDVEFATPSDSPERRNNLWEATCLELFLSAPGSDSYREFNLSPAHHWNVYRFDGYRQGMREETLIRHLPFSTERTAGGFRLSLEVGISALFPGDGPLEAGVTAVIRMRDGTTTYWALAHTGPEPDFHRRDSFILLLPGREGA